MKSSSFYYIFFTNHQWALIWAMAKRSVHSQYIGSFLGFLWMLIQPAVMITVFWFVFSIGFKARPMNDVPFVVWLASGMAPWYVFSAIIASSANAIVTNGHLIKKTVFPVQILPVVQVVSNMVGHFAFLVIVLILLAFNNLPISFWYCQVVYYLVCLWVLALGLGYLVSALNVFIRDISQIVGVLLQIGFWATPIFWDINMMPEKIQQILQLNPVYYIVQGYRDSFISFIPFWERTSYGIYFWCVTLLIFFISVAIFKKLQPQFADVL